MALFTLLCVIFVAITGLTSGSGVLPDDSVDAALGGTVVFTTSLAPTQTPFTVVIWSFGTKNIITSTTTNTTVPEYEDRITLFMSTGSLELRAVALNDTGEYTVNIVAGGSTTPGATKLNVYEPVSNVTIRVNSTDLVEFNSSVRLSCSSSGFSPSFLWFNQSSELTANDRVHLTDKNSTLTVVSVSRYDQGPFRCRAFNPVSSSSEEVNVSISFGPDDVMLTVFPSNELYVEGSDITLSCSADSRPEAGFKWFLNRELLSFTGAQFPLVNIQMNQSGNYSCQAFNNKTLRYTTSQPSVISVLKKISEASVKSSTPMPLERTFVNLTCDASGSNITREWTKDGLSLKPSENIVFFDQNQVVSFKNLTRKDKGSYTCKISNPISSQDATYVLNVNYGPEKVQILGPKEVQVKTKLELICSADSVPAANYTWIKNETTIGHTSKYIKDITEYSDSGDYICRATNNVANQAFDASHTVLVNETVTGTNSNSCSTGCIVGSVFGCIVFVLLVSGAVFYILKKKKQKKSVTRTDGEGQNNTACSQNQAVNYADVRFMKNDGAVVNLGAQQNNSQFADGQRNNNPPAASHLPTYNAHMQRAKRAAPQPVQTGTEYAEVRIK